MFCRTIGAPSPFTRSVFLLNSVGGSFLFAFFAFCMEINCFGVLCGASRAPQVLSFSIDVFDTMVRLVQEAVLALPVKINRLWMLVCTIAAPPPATRSVFVLHAVARGFLFTIFAFCTEGIGVRVLFRTIKAPLPDTRSIFLFDTPTWSLLSTVFTFALQINRFWMRFRTTRAPSENLFAVFIFDTVGWTLVLTVFAFTIEINGICVRRLLFLSRDLVVYSCSRHTLVERLCRSILSIFPLCFSTETQRLSFLSVVVWMDSLPTRSAISRWNCARYVPHLFFDACGKHSADCCAHVSFLILIFHLQSLFSQYVRLFGLAS
jgi:hypothetical protein